MLVDSRRDLPIAPAEARLPPPLLRATLSASTEARRPRLYLKPLSPARQLRQKGKSNRSFSAMKAGSFAVSALGKNSICA